LCPEAFPPSRCTTDAFGCLGSAPDCRPRRTSLHLSYSYAAPFGPAILVTQDPERTIGAAFCRDAQRNLACNDVVPSRLRARHETTRVHLNARWCGSVAARGARAAVDGTAGWVP